MFDQLKADNNQAILEIRAGRGGQEAERFCAYLFGMYKHCAERRQWTPETLCKESAKSGGLKEVVFSIQGEGVCGKLQYETGLHRMQRVPAGGERIHTSVVTVAVLPESDETEIESSEIEIELFQSVCDLGLDPLPPSNKAVRITHLPIGLTVTCDEAGSQEENRQRAMRIIRAHLHDRQMKKLKEKTANNGEPLVAGGDLNQCIRTYNVPQNRVTDHRIDLTLIQLSGIMAGDLDELLEKLTVYFQLQR